MFILNSNLTYFRQNQVKAFDKFNEYRIEPSEIDIKKCIKYITQAWNNITNKTIENCWVKADILPKDNHENEDKTGNYILLEL